MLVHRSLAQGPPRCQRITGDYAPARAHRSAGDTFLMALVATQADGWVWLAKSSAAACVVIGSLCPCTAQKKKNLLKGWHVNIICTLPNPLMLIACLVEEAGRAGQGLVFECPTMARYVWLLIVHMLLKGGVAASAPHQVLYVQYFVQAENTISDWHGIRGANCRGSLDSWCYSYPYLYCTLLAFPTSLLQGITPASSSSHTASAK